MNVLKRIVNIFRTTESEKTQELKRELGVLEKEMSYNIIHNRCDCLEGLKRDMTTDKCIICQTPMIVGNGKNIPWVTDDILNRAKVFWKERYHMDA